MAKAKSKSRFNAGFGAIYQRKTKDGKVRWYLDYRDAGGKRVQRVAGRAVTQEDAFLALKRAVFHEHYRELGIPEISQKAKFSEFSRMYLENYAKINKRSWRDDQYRLEANMIPFFGNSDLQEITPLMIEQYRRGRLESGVTKSTVNRETALLKKMFNVAMNWSLAQRNPVLGIKMFSERDGLKERILAYDEEARFLAECPAFLQPIVVMALHTGMRRGEILNVKWDQIDLEKRIVQVKHTKNGKDRLIPINESLFSVLASLKRQAIGDLVFPNPQTGKPYTEVKKSFKLACKKAGLSGIRFHDLRHTFASRLIAAGVDLVTVRDLLGHFSVTVTQRYTHPGNGQKIQAVALLARQTPPESENLLHPCYTN